MRLVIDIDGDQVRVHRMDGDEVPPVDVLAKGAAMNAQSAGLAKLRSPEHASPSDIVLTSDDLGRGASDAGRAPSAPRGARFSTTRRTSRARKPSKAR